MSSVQNPRTARTIGVIGCLLCALAVAVTPARAQPLAERVPADAMVYVGWRGADAVSDQYDNSHLAAVVRETAIQRMVRESIPAALRAIEMQTNAEHTDAFVDAVAQSAATMWRRPWALHATMSVRGRGGPPQPHVALTIDAGDQARTVRRVADRLLTQMRRSANAPMPPIQTRLDAGMVTLSFGRPPGGGALATDARFRRAQNQVPADALMVTYVDAAGVLDLMTQAPGSELRPRTLELLGLDGLEQLIFTTGFDGRNWRTDLFVGASGQRRGLLRLLEGDALDEQALAQVPHDVTWLSAGRLDLNAMLQTVRQALRQSDRRQAQQLDQMLQQVGMMVGVDLENELIAGLGPTWLSYADPQVAGPNYMSAVLVNPLRKPDAVRRALGRLEQMANGMLLQQQRRATQGVLQWRMTKQQQGEMTIHTATLPMLSPSWAVHDGKLYIGLLPQTLMAAAEAPERSILENPKFTDMRQRLDAGANLNSISYIDLEARAPLTYQSYLMLTQTAPAAGIAFGGQGPSTLLPPLRKLLRHVRPAGGASWSDDAGWHMRWSSAFPGSTMLSRQPLGGLLSNPMSLQTSAMSIGMLLPALGEARDTARQMQSNTQGRGIHQGQVIYAQSHKPEGGGDGRFSNDIAELVQQNYFSVDYAISPFKEKSPGGHRDWASMSEAAQNRWIRQHASYILVPDLVEDLDSEKIAVFLRPSHSNGEGITVVYNDNHTEWETDIDAIRRQLERQTGMTMQELIERQVNYRPDQTDP